MTPINEQIDQMRDLAQRHYPEDPTQRSECLVRLLEERLRTFAKFVEEVDRVTS